MVETACRVGEAVMVEDMGEAQGQEMEEVDMAVAGMEVEAEAEVGGCRLAHS